MWPALSTGWGAREPLSVYGGRPRKGSGPKALPAAGAPPGKGEKHGDIRQQTTQREGAHGQTAR